MPFIFVAIFVFGGMAALSLIGCGPSYTAADTTANTTGARAEARVLQLCAVGMEDAGTCTPSRVRGETDLAYCANVRELIVHSAPVPEAGVDLACTPQ
jgi:hypothetical protein